MKRWHKNVEIMVSLKYLSNFWKTIEMPLINCEINLDLNWYKNALQWLLMQQIMTQHF